MRLTYFQQVPYRHLPPNFEHEYSSVVTTPYRKLVDDRRLVADYRDALDELLFAAREGFDAVAVTEHGQSSYDMVPNPDLILAAIAYATASEGIDVGIYPIGRSLGKTREPLRVAEELAMIDCMSDGRLIAGFPVGLPYDASINNGVPQIETRARFDENLRLITKAWTADDIFAWNGRYAQHAVVNIWPRPVQSPTPPIWITGSGSPKTMEFVLKQGYGFNSFGQMGRKGAQATFGKLWETADRSGIAVNPNRAGLVQCICIAETDAEAERLYAPHVEYYFRKASGALGNDAMNLPGGVELDGLKAAMRAPGGFSWDMLKGITMKQLMGMGSVICGSPSTVREQLRDLVDALGVANVLAMLQIGSMPRELTEHNIRLFMREVAPCLRAHSKGSTMPNDWWPERLKATESSEDSPVRETAQ
ncbi:alkanesulfonate monooxygenase SsuD/methylene tetrahydromethanopterin reductase-like flavin-dependent oxidoreductase (luciferase family) [Sphingobium xenophagum]|uniref:Alkanesulfonate monooxygenase SsuD/methylene tetrahydromethanopterin reductase-like flavin-dependent oxidoreductase (Luciferase family) n=1 Tax=Sphingobium xenophagum TaxID=121428 RepID=A0ABU1X5H9_SPHXE|nr:LLM class flavin-dependent oxidoreductase [Sphingobium xenophagum]MDR7156830.1 alkanesulfonate monooxygenase SsuD/methylene tetrahydromethanopterin reductase-like flavin-dependent oxidoreductase (luciferase family) [Sphingobium xenophagum]